MLANSYHVRFRDRLISLEQEARDGASARADLRVEMKSAGLSKADIAGIKLAVRRHFETSEQRAERESAEEIATALGEFAFSPLGAAAIGRAA